jgi:nicotinamide/nicotinate riboside kinase
MVQTKLIGISGCTNGGKTTLSKRLQKEFPNSTHLSQDDFYYPRDSKHYTYIPELESFNFDVISVINMEKFYQELKKLILSEKYEFIFLDGFLLYEDEKIYNLLDKKYFLSLDKEECIRRRASRNYKTIDTPNYFEKCVWVEFLKYKQKCQSKYKDIIYLNGHDTADQIFDLVKSQISREAHF